MRFSIVEKLQKKEALRDISNKGKISLAKASLHRELQYPQQNSLKPSKLETNN